MTAPAVIAELANVPSFNVWLGPGPICSGSLVEQPGFDAMTWADVCMSALALQCRIRATVFRFVDPLLPRMVAAQGVLAPHWRATGCSPLPEEKAELQFFELPGAEAGDPVWLGRIAEAAGAGTPWLVAGVDAPEPADIAALQSLASAGSRVFWVQSWGAPAPNLFGCAVISGHDAQSFLAALLQACDEFPPRHIAARAQLSASEPEAGLQQMLHEAKAFYRDSAHRWANPSGSAESVPLLDDIGFEQWQMEESRRETLLGRCAVRFSPLAQAINRMFIARALGGRRADTVLRWVYADCLSESIANGVQGLHHRKLMVEVLRLRARWRKPELARQFYIEGHKLIQAIPDSQPLLWEPAMEFALLLMDWSRVTPVEDATPIVSQAIQLLKRALRGHPRGFEESVLWQQQANHLRNHALRLNSAEAGRYFDEARHCAVKVAECDAKPRPIPGLGPLPGMEHLNLATIAATQARVDRERQFDLLAEAGKHFEAFIAASPAGASTGYCDWATALSHFVGDGKLADQSMRLFEQAALTARADGAQSAVLHHNWSAILLQRARGCTARSEREEWLAVAERKARRAMELRPGMGSFNLACIHAQRGDWTQTEYWLRLAARFPFLPSRAECDADQDLELWHVDSRFEVLTEQIFP